MAKKDIKSVLKNKTSQKASREYSGKQIMVLEGIEPVRKRPAMYIGSTDLTGLHRLVTEIVDNAVDEALAGHAKNVWVILNKDGSVTVIDDGRGIPVDNVPAYNKSALEIVMTKLHAGAKFGQKAYTVSTGLHGVGASVVNALSEWLEAVVIRQGRVYRQKYERGKPVTAVTEIPKTKDQRPRAGEEIVNGTFITFKPDAEVFKLGSSFDWEILKRSLKNRAYLIAGLYFHLEDKSQECEYHFYFDGGIASLVESLNTHKKAVHPVITLSGREKDIEIAVAFAYVEGYQENVQSFVNVVETVEGGSHVSGFRSALTRSLNDYAKKEGYLSEKEENFSGADTREGLTAVISVKMPGDRVQFEGQTKAKLGNAEIAPLVQNIVSEGLKIYFEENPREAAKIVEKVVLAAKARRAAAAAKEAVIRKAIFEGGGLPGKLADCQTREAAQAELFVVEGDSAGGTAKQGRDRKFQAILPLWGKVLNTERYRLDKIVKNDKFKPLILALGAGIGEYFNIEKLRYHKIIIMTDADVDGRHIEALYLTLFFRHLRQIIETGHLFVANPPLYKASWGQKRHYLFSEDEREAFLRTNGGLKVNIQRFKGLGEMNAEELWETTMNPVSRILKKVTLEDAARAEKTFTTLMGEEVGPRKHFIQARAKQADLDI